MHITMIIVASPMGMKKNIFEVKRKEDNDDDDFEDTNVSMDNNDDDEDDDEDDTEDIPTPEQKFQPQNNPEKSALANNKQQQVAKKPQSNIVQGKKNQAVSGNQNSNAALPGRKAVNGPGALIVHQDDDEEDGDDEEEENKVIQKKIVSLKQDVQSKLPESKKKNKKGLHSETPKDSVGAPVYVQQSPVASQQTSSQTAVVPNPLPSAQSSSTNATPSSKVHDNNWTQFKKGLIRLQRPNLPPKPQQLRCELCKIKCPRLRNYKQHLEGRRHKRKEAAAKVGGNVSQLSRCELCDVTCSGSDNYTTHIRGIRHQKVVKLLMKLGIPIPSTEPEVLSPDNSTPIKPSLSENKTLSTKVETAPPTAGKASPPKITFVSSGSKPADVEINDEEMKDEILSGELLKKEVERKSEQLLRHLIVTGFPGGTTAEEIGTLSSDILNVTIPRYFVLECESEEKAEKIYKHLHGKKFKDRDIFVYVRTTKRKKAKNVLKDRLLCEGIPAGTNLSDIAVLFPTAFNISLNSSADHRTAIATFHSVEDAAEALKANKNSEIQGKSIVVQYAPIPNFKEQQMKRKSKSETNEAEPYEAEPYEAEPYEAESYEAESYETEPYETEHYETEYYETEYYETEHYETEHYETEPYEGRPSRPYGGRPSRPFGGHPSRPFGGHPSGPFGGRRPRPFGGRPSRPSGGRPSRAHGGPAAKKRRL